MGNFLPGSLAFGAGYRKADHKDQEGKRKGKTIKIKTMKPRMNADKRVNSGQRRASDLAGLEGYPTTKGTKDTKTKDLTHTTGFLP